MTALRSPSIRSGCVWPIAGVAVGSLASILVFAIGSLGRTALASRVYPTPLATVIPYASATSAARTEVPVVDQPTANGTPTRPPSGPGDFRPGELVEVFGTEGGGLRVRNEPSVNSVVNIVALENEVFEVRGGPTLADGYVWWFLVNPYDIAKQGWAVGDFLRPLD